MKIINLNVFSVSALMGLVFAASAVTRTNSTPPMVGAKYPLNAQFTNNPPVLANVNALPLDTANTNLVVAGGAGVITTDGSGKIDGVQDISSSLGGGTNANFVADVTGLVTGTGKSNGAAVVSLVIKGSGFAWNTNGAQTAASVLLSFKGTSGVTPNSQVIDTNVAGFDFILNSDGTTNVVDRYDPYTNTHGTNQSFFTLTGVVDDWSATSIETTNGSSVLVSNTVNSSIINYDIVGTDCDGNTRTLKFGTPVDTNPACFYDVYATSVPRFIIAQSVHTIDRLHDSNNNFVIYTTNEAYTGSGTLLSSTVVTNYSVFLDFSLASSNNILTVNYSFDLVSPSLDGYYYFVDPANIARGVIFRNLELDTNGNPTMFIYTLSQEYFYLATGPTTNGSTTYTNAALTYAVTARTNGSPGPGVVFSTNIANDLIYSNYVNLPATNFGLQTNNIYGVALTNLPTVLAAFYAQYDFTNGYAYSGSTTPSFDDTQLYPNMFVTNAEVSLVAQIITNSFPASVTNSMEAERIATNKWYSIRGVFNGTITAGRLRRTLKNEPGILEGKHKLFTPIPAASGEADYLVAKIPGNLDVLTKSNLEAEVVMWNNVFSTASPLSGCGKEDDYSGLGRVILKNGIGNYTANLRGISRDSGSSLSLKGNTRTLISGYDVISNAPAVVSNIVNIAAIPPSPAPPYVLSISNTTSGFLTVSGDYSFTNFNGNVTTIYNFTFPSFTLTNYVYHTNYATNAISSVDMNGRVMGQILPKDTMGVNVDAVNIIGPVPSSAQPALNTNYYGWPLSQPSPY